MVTNSVVLHGTDERDLLALPAIVLGFRPRESCVVLALRQRRVQFCSRMDLDWYTTDFAEVAVQLLNACDEASPCQVVLLGYGQDRREVAASLRELIDVFEGDVMRVLSTDGEQLWCDEEVWGDGPGEPYCWLDSAVVAEAVYQGIVIVDSRAEAVAEVMPPPGADDGALAQLLAQERAAVQGMSLTEAMRQFDSLVAAPTGLRPEQAGRLAVLLETPQLVSEVMSRLTRADAKSLRVRLLQARAQCDARAAINVLALLAVTCWLTGYGAQQSACMEQLDRLQPQHPVLEMLVRLHHLGIPPQRWDDD
ncbi:MAG: hypothetical protein CSA64_05185 [Arachnia propionica]|nr:MAG: hypothetical protein CSA64_05185 [Arachnia propionica]